MYCNISVLSVGYNYNYNYNRDLLCAPYKQNDGALHCFVLFVCLFVGLLP